MAEHSSNNVSNCFAGNESQMRCTVHCTTVYFILTNLLMNLFINEMCASSYFSRVSYSLYREFVYNVLHTLFVSVSLSFIELFKKGI